MPMALDNLLKAEVYLTYFSKDAYKAARRLYLEAIDTEPELARPYTELAYAVLQAYLYNWYEGKPEDAIQEMKDLVAKALDKDPQDPYNIWVKADVMLYCKNFDGAHSTYENALGGAKMLNPTHADEWAYQVDYADFLLLTGDPKTAISIVNGVLGSCPLQEKWFYWVLAWAYYVDEQFDASLDALSHFRNPRNAMRKNVVANLAALGRLSEAQAQATAFLVEEKAQGITYAVQGDLVLPGLSSIEDRVPFKSPAMLQRWKNDLEKAFDKLVQP